MEKLKRHRKNILRRVVATGLALSLDACALPPKEHESSSITCDGVTISAAAGSIEISPLITKKSDVETPVSIRLGTGFKDPSVPFSDGSIRIDIPKDGVRVVTIVVLTNSIGSVATCPAVPIHV